MALLAVLTNSSRRGLYSLLVNAPMSPSDEKILRLVAMSEKARLAISSALRKRPMKVHVSGPRGEYVRFRMTSPTAKYSSYATIRLGKHGTLGVIGRVGPGKSELQSVLVPKARVFAVARKYLAYRKIATNPGYDWSKVKRAYCEYCFKKYKDLYPDGTIHRIYPDGSLRCTQCGRQSLSATRRTKKNSGEYGYYVMGSSGIGTMSRAWYPTRAQAEAEVKRIIMIGAWRDRQPWVEEAQAPSGRYRRTKKNPPDQHGLKKLAIYKVLHSPELKQKGLAGKAVVFLGMVEGPAGGTWAAIRSVDSENEILIRPWLLVDPVRARYPNPLTRAEYDDADRYAGRLEREGNELEAKGQGLTATRRKSRAEGVRDAMWRYGQNPRQNPGHEELKRSMYAHLREAFGHDPDDEFDIEAAIYWYASDHYAGMGDPLYGIISTSRYKPGRMKRSARDEGEMAGMMYDELDAKFEKKNPRRNADWRRGVPAGAYPKEKPAKFVVCLFCGRGVLGKHYRAHIKACASVPSRRNPVVPRGFHNPFYITDQAGFNRDKAFATKSAAKKALWYHRPVVRHSTREGVPVGQYAGEFVWQKNQRSRKNPLNTRELTEIAALAQKYIDAVWDSYNSKSWTRLWKEVGFLQGIYYTLIRTEGSKTIAAGVARERITERVGKTINDVMQSARLEGHPFKGNPLTKRESASLLRDALAHTRSAKRYAKLEWPAHSAFHGGKATGLSTAVHAHGSKRAKRIAGWIRARALHVPELYLHKNNEGNATPNIPFVQGRKYKPEVIERWVATQPEAVQRRWAQAVKQYKSFHLGAMPESVTFNVQMLGVSKNITDVEFGVSEGKEWMAPYQVPKHSGKFEGDASQGRYVHAHGDSKIDVNIKRPAKLSRLPERFHTPDGKFVGVIPAGTKVKISDWYRH